MKYRVLVAFSLAAILMACGDDESSNNANNVNNVNNSNNANNSNNSNNANNSNNVNNSNNANNSNNSNNTNNSNNSNNSNNGAGEFIVADVDGAELRAESEQRTEMIGENLQIAASTLDQGGASVFIYRIQIPNGDAATYDCATDNVTVTYSRLDGQLITNWTSSDTCTIEITQGAAAADEVIQGTFSATTSDGNTTVELTNGQFSIIRD